LNSQSGCREAASAVTAELRGPACCGSRRNDRVEDSGDATASPRLRIIAEAPEVLRDCVHAGLAAPVTRRRRRACAAVGVRRSPVGTASGLPEGDRST